ncbi:MAG TPA: hypothetical protein VJL56_07055 [Candidatus Bathyarchaeia archaeon]|nr:hypothetical protein [Candidatus Bathyarchaeia archaeon]
MRREWKDECYQVSQDLPFVRAMPKYPRGTSHSESDKPSASSEKMIARYFGYMALSILLVVALIGAYYLGK